MNFFDALILGLVEGITEFLPISSTGHLLLTQKCLGLPASAGMDAYLIVIQFGAILAILALYPGRITEGLKGVGALVRRDWQSRGWRFLSNIIMAFIPAAAVGLLADKWIEAKLFNPVTVAAAFVAGGVVMLVFNRKEGGKEVDEMDWRQSLTVGVWQIASLWPGMSRSMTTIVGAEAAGMKRAAAAEFSFVLGAAVLTAASLYKLIKFHNEIFALGVAPVLIGIVAAFLSAWVVVRIFVGLLNRWGLVPWAIYRFVAAAVVWAVMR